MQGEVLVELFFYGRNFTSQDHRREGKGNRKKLYIN